MFKPLRTGLAALAVSALVVVPVATVVTIVSADAAYAKNGNGNGNGNGGNRGGGKGGGGKGNSGGEKSADKGGKSKGKGFENGQKNRTANKGNGNKGGKGLGRAVKDDFNRVKNNVRRNGIAGLFQKDSKSKSARTVAAKRTKNAPKASVRPAKKVGYKFDNPMHPSNLGKMNGLLNSSPRAKEAHIANGQWAKGTGPVSIGAALAVADYQKAAAETLETEQTFTDADMAVDDSITAGIAVNPDLNSVEAAQAVLADEGSFTVDEVKAANDIANAQMARDALDDDTRPTMTEVEKAQSVVDDMVANNDTGFTDPIDIAHANVDDAEEAVLGSYKGDPTGYEDDIIGAARDAVSDVDVHAAKARAADKETTDPYDEVGYEDDAEDDAYDDEDDLDEDDKEAAMIEISIQPDQG